MDDIHLINFIKGDLSEEQKSKVQSWISESSVNKAHFDAIRAIWESKNPLTEQSNIDAAWERLQTERDYQRRQTSIKRHYLAAAIIPLLIASVWFLFKNDINTIQYSSQNDPLSMIELPDGSKVWLNEYSTLTLSKGFNDSERNVKLSGEAFFDVKRDEERPFIIHSKNTTTTVLGTSFNVMSYPDSANSRIDVASGKVSVHSNEKTDSKTLLTKGMSAIYDPESKKLITKNTTTSDNRFAWRTKKLVFENAGAHEITRWVKKVYDVDLLFKQDASCIQLNATFADEPLENILNTLQALYDLTYQRVSEGSYEIHGNCTQNSK
jgi:ferric-dicitrate binding protein FerR (iron transport regulator)